MSGMWKEWGGDRPEVEVKTSVVDETAEVSLRQYVAQERAKDKARMKEVVLPLIKSLETKEVVIAAQSVDINMSKGTIEFIGLTANGVNMPWELTSRMMLTHLFGEDANAAKGIIAIAVLENMGVNPLSSVVEAFDCWEAVRKLPNKFRITFKKEKGLW